MLAFALGTNFRLDDDDPTLPNELVSRFSKRPTMEPSEPNDGGSSIVEPHSAAMFFPGAIGVVADVGVVDAVDDTFEALLLQYSVRTPPVLAFLIVAPTPPMDGDLATVAVVVFVTAVPVNAVVVEGCGRSGNTCAFVWPFLPDGFKVCRSTVRDSTVSTYDDRFDALRMLDDGVVGCEWEWE